MTDFLVDSHVILDVLTEDPHWFDWSAAQSTLTTCRSLYANRSKTRSLYLHLLGQLLGSFC